MSDKIIYNVSEDRKHWKTLHESKNLLLGSHHLNKGEVLEVTITNYTNETILDRDGNEIEKAILHFKETQPMVCNITNAETLELLYGSDYEQWFGKRVQIHEVTIQKPGAKKGIMTGALRILNVKPTTDADAKPYIDKLGKCKDMDELKKTFAGIPKEMQGKCVAAKDKMKGKLS